MNYVFRHLKNIYWLKFCFTSIQLNNLSGDLQAYFLFENYFNLRNAFFVMYTDIPEFYLISPTALMMNDLHLSSYMIDKEKIRGCKVFFAEKMAEIGAL